MPGCISVIIKLYNLTTSTVVVYTCTYTIQEECVGAQKMQLSFSE